MKAQKFIVFLILGILVVISNLLVFPRLPLWRDTRIHSSGSGDIKLASGHTVPANKWFSFPEDAGPLGFLQIYEGGKPHNYLFQDGISRDLAVMTTPEGPKRLELIQAGGSDGRTEFWLEPRELKANH